MAKETKTRRRASSPTEVAPKAGARRLNELQGLAGVGRPSGIASYVPNFVVLATVEGDPSRLRDFADGGAPVSAMQALVKTEKAR